MLRALTRNHRNPLQGTTRVLFFRPDRPRAIDRILRYFGDVPAPALASVLRSRVRRPGRL
jgi:hypothetical protein